MSARPALFAVALALLFSAGCGPPKLNESRNWTLTAGDYQSLDLPAIAKDQKVTVEFTATSEVKVIAIKEEDSKGDPSFVNESKALGKAEGKSGQFAVDVPAKTPIRIIAGQAASKAEVTITVTNSK